MGDKVSAKRAMIEAGFPRRSALRGRTDRFYASPLAEKTYANSTVEAGESVACLPPCRFSAVNAEERGVPGAQLVDSGTPVR